MIQEHKDIQYEVVRSKEGFVGHWFDFEGRPHTTMPKKTQKHAINAVCYGIDAYLRRIGSKLSGRAGVIEDPVSNHEKTAFAKKCGYRMPAGWDDTSIRSQEWRNRNIDYCKTYFEKVQLERKLERIKP